MTLYEQSLEYHSRGRKGKIEVVPSKPVSTQQDLSLAYSPGVAEPCRIIAEKEDLVYEYTAKGNLVSVISGSAFLNALELTGKDIRKVRVVFCGGGAAAIACANLYLNLGVKRENVIMCDSKGVIYKGRKEGRSEEH